MSLVEIKVPDIGDFKEVEVIELGLFNLTFKVL